MGAPMAENLLKAGYALSVYDLFKDATQRLQQAGAKVADSPKGLQAMHKSSLACCPLASMSILSI